MKIKILPPLLLLFIFTISLNAATFVVNSTSDGIDANIGDNVCETAISGECTLRAAILEANFAAGIDIINFNISGAGVKTIAPNSALPDIIQPLTIDGYSQPGARVNNQATIDNAVILIELNGTNAGAGANGLRLFASNSTIKGLAINRFGRVGVSLPSSSNSIISGNFIGTDTTGTLARPNNVGISANIGSNSLIGGTTAGAGNLISGNTGDGISVGNTGNLNIKRNRIGTAADGVSALANSGDGIEIASGGSNNLIGGLDANDGNIIAFNGLNGIQITDSGVAPINNPILGNAIYSNSGLGINLSLDAVTPNDASDADAGANNLQNFPVITAAQLGSTRVIGTLNSTANTMFRIEFFNSPISDVSGSGEGQFFVGAVNVMTDGSGNVSFDQTFAPDSPLNSYISATATNLTTLDTSEFSNAKQVLNPTAAQVYISGQVLTPKGNGISGARISLTDSNGFVRNVITNSFGFYRFTNVAAGETYVLTARHKSRQFIPQVISVNEELSEVNFIAENETLW